MYVIHPALLRKTRKMILSNCEKIDRIKECTNELEGTNGAILIQDEDNKRLYQILEKYTRRRGNNNK
jgi:hypothetical protein